MRAARRRGSSPPRPRNNNPRRGRRPAPAQQQMQAGKPSSTEAQNPATGTVQQTIHATSKTVRVDVVVTDKSGKYVHDLNPADFKVFEDKKQQEITTFTKGNSPAGPNQPLPQHYVILFFDDSSMSQAEQLRARKAAQDFISQAASPQRLMAVAEFTGALKLTQNFTASVPRLQAAVGGVKNGSVRANGPAPDDSNAGAPVISLGNIGNTGASESDFAAHSLLLALSDFSRALTPIPGRKTLILFTSGFPMTPDRMSDMSTTIAAANKADVAIYPLDVRGLAAPGARMRPFWPAPDSAARVVLASYIPPSPEWQRGGGGSGGHGGGGGGGTGGGGGHGGGGGTGGGGGHGGGGGTGRVGNGTNYNSTPALPAMLVPPFQSNATANQQVMYLLASGTGGFPIVDTNDLVAGMDRIANELDEYYVIGYAQPLETVASACHTITVKVDRPKTNVRSRTGYCDVKSKDALANEPESAALEARALSNTAKSSDLPAVAQAPFFYSSANSARVDFVAQLPPGALKSLPMEKGKPAPVDVLGIVTRADGSAAARFSDSVNLEKDAWKELEKQPFDYQNSFDVAPGNYTLRVVIGAGEGKFATWEQPLAIPAYDGKSMALSAIAMSSEVHPISGEAATIDSELLEDRKTLVAQGMEFTPSATLTFDRKKMMGYYAEIYDPLLTANPPPKVAIIYVVIDEATGKQAYNSKGLSVAQFMNAGNPVIPVAFRIPMDTLPAGKYRLDVQSADDKGNHTSVRSVHFVTQ